MQTVKIWLAHLGVRIGICFGWILLVMGFYYWGHKPFDAAWVLNTLQFLAPLCVALLLVISAGLLGYRILGRKHGANPLVMLVLQVILGSGLLAVLLLIVGLTLGVSAWISWGILLFVFVLQIRNISSWFQQWRTALFKPRSLSAFDRWLMILLGVCLFFSLLTNWLPVFHFDALMYHFMLPKAYLLEGHIHDLPWQIQSGMPQNGEMFYLWGLSLLNETTALLIVWLLGITALLGLGTFISEQFGLRSALVGIGSFLCGYTVLSSLSWGYVDWVTFLFSSGLLLAFFTWLIHQKMEWLVIAGILGGLLMGSKYTSGAVLISVEVAITVFCLRTRKAWWKDMLAFNLPLLLVFSPWLIKNFVFTGNPVYPLFFVSGNMTPIRIETYQSAPPWGNWLDFVFLPIMATITGFQGADGFGNAIGPLLLGLGGLFWVGWHQFDLNQRMLLKTVIWMSATGLLVWAFANQMSGFLVQTRMHYGLFPLFIVLSAVGFRGMMGLNMPAIRLSKIVQAGVLLVISLTMIEFGTNVIQMQTISVLSGKIKPDEFLANNLGWYQPAMQAIKAMPEDTHTLLLYETRSYHCLPNCQPDEILDRWKRDWQTYGDREAILQAWRREGITHVLVYHLGIEYALDNWVTDDNRETLNGLEEFIVSLPQAQEEFGSAYALYDIRQ